MPDWASGGGLKIERAKEHISEFEADSRAFLQANPYFGVSQFDQTQGRLTFVVRGPNQIPPRLSSVAADAVQNLRSSLDILWHRVWAPETAKARKVYFPMFENPHALETRFKGVKEASQKAAVDILRRAKPYKSGNKPLYDLFEIAPRDRHETPVLSVAAYNKIIFALPPNVTYRGKRGLQFHFTPLDASGAVVHLFLKDGAPLPMDISVETTGGPVVEVKCQLPADIAFGEGEILEGEPVPKTLHEFLDVTNAIVEAFRLAGLVS
ncbi:MAG TPA: hypothetical protein VN908_08085 [Gemmatimonadales bacterium]|nr:hypothetical protein [Gemmatimonadales bacterium]